MASSVVSSATTVAGVSRSQSAVIAPFTGLKSAAAFPVTRKNNADLTSLASNGSKVNCMQVWPTTGLRKFETLSYLPDLSDTELAKEVDYLLRNNWIPCLEFELGNAFVYRENHRSPGYYDGRYWTMWKLPMFGCTDSAQVMKELQEAKTTHPDAHIRIIGFDNVRQVQCISFIAYKPKAT
ncbi:PREDICTED: ribulose bisphosphate carboxylase small chain, chloroplastic-like [Tarenaya hassleriana]|uniref:ribulose bisphosphate carboxylase small chain, chloroplastic-like n=1 Tax=Tarenaya hassleriana TaxID=28532 RepID=UPI00053C873A|nr:PREDICTED: ribulose bisphosphate carboxylase small chain, chloroplastic-like [Tarenaya hassleriana]